MYFYYLTPIQHGDFPFLQMSLHACIQKHQIQTGMRFLEFVIISIWGNAFRRLVVSGRIDDTSRPETSQSEGNIGDHFGSKRPDQVRRRNHQYICFRNVIPAEHTRNCCEEFYC